MQLKYIRRARRLKPFGIAEGWQFFGLFEWSEIEGFFKSMGVWKSFCVELVYRLLYGCLFLKSLDIIPYLESIYIIYSAVIS